MLLRTLIGGALTAVVLLRGGFDRSASAPSAFLLLRRTALGLNWIALFEAYRLLNVSLATLLYYVGPMLVLLLSPLLFREKLWGQSLPRSILWPWGLSVSAASSAAVTLRSCGGAFLSALFYAALIVFNKRIKRSPGLQTAGH